MAGQSSSSGAGGPLPITLKLLHRPPGSDESRLYGRVLSSKPIRNAVVKNVLKAAWARFSSVKMIDVDESTIAFEVANSRERDQILDFSPWSIQGSSLNIRSCGTNRSLAELNFNKLDIWMQAHGLSIDACNADNARQIGNSVGRCIQVESEHVMRQRCFLKFKVEIDVTVPLHAGFKWINEEGTEKWASF